MLIAEFTSRIPNMGERVAHVKSCELLKSLQSAINLGNQQRSLEFKSSLNVQRLIPEPRNRIYGNTSAGILKLIF